ncbi:trafficking kinesin-binding protein 2 isoform X2 [Engraulis encrasicolus]|uniref:trafficking kinesin-binding protein 2 isoform X2 n=1 Tax=Engraulis encrasicolus TaxID=184585 RepID=UPI002FD66BC8
MFEFKPMSVEKKEAATGTEEGGRGGSSSSGGSVYLYEAQDWVISPACSPDEPSAISPMLAEETLRYMTFLALEPTTYSHPGPHGLSKVLSAERVEQMTKTYNDIDVVTHLLGERDRDLELAARIGQSLLQRNHVLQERNESLEEQLAQAVDRVQQLQHDLGKKDELLRMVASASEESETDSSSAAATPLKHSHAAGGAASISLSQLEALQGKLQDLEEENLTLRSEACHLKTETICYEEKEEQLVRDCVKELRESNSQMVGLTDELSKKNDELIRHQEEIAQLLSQIVELQHRVKELALEKEELRIHLQASKDAQRQLTAELKELSERNVECVGMLHESQEEIKELRSKQAPSAGLRRHTPFGLYPMESLAAEIEGSMRREMSVEEETVFQDQRVSQKRVFQTVRAVNETVERAAALAPPPPIPGSGRSSVVMMTARPFNSHEPADTTKEASSRVGCPGSPGVGDLASALHRLSLRRQNYVVERQYFQKEHERRLQELAAQEQGQGGGTSGGSSPMGSAVSSFTNLSEFSFCSSASTFKTFLPEKLQIVKPMEGSLTLHHWQQLAQPHLASMLDPHPGVVTKGFRPLPLDHQDPQATYRLTDLEEDEEGEGSDRKKGERRASRAHRRDLHLGEGESEERVVGGGRQPNNTQTPWRDVGMGDGEEAEEKGARRDGGSRGETTWRRRKEKVEDEEEEDEGDGGITFVVQCSSTPEDKKLETRSRPVVTETKQQQQQQQKQKHVLAPLSLTTSPAVAAATTAASSGTQHVTQEKGDAEATTGGSGAQASGAQTHSSTAPSSANPGKSQSSTFSTYTFTTCRIMHPCDVTQVTSSAVCSPCVSEQHTPSSMRTGPSTPVTPCLLSLGNSSFPPRHFSPAPPRGLAKLLLERGISAQVASSSSSSSETADPASAASSAASAAAASAAAVALGDPLPVRRPKPGSIPFRLLPNTPPNSPSHSPCPSPVPFDQPRHSSISSSSSSSAAAAGSDNFLASRPAELFLQDVYGVRFGRAPRPDLPSPEPPSPSPPTSSHNDSTSSLVERLCRLGLAGALPGASADPAASHRQDSTSTFLATGGGSLLDGLRRNQSLPALISRGPRGSVSSPSHSHHHHHQATAAAGGPQPPQHPTSLALPTPPWGSLKPNPQPSSRRHASISHPPPYQGNH